MQENWCASAANLRNFQVTANSYPLSCTKQIKSNVSWGKEKNTQVTTLSLLGTKQISAPAVRCTNMFIYTYLNGNNEDFSTAVKLSLAITRSHAEHGGPSGCVCNMTVHLMDSDCHRMVSQCGHSDFSATTQLAL
jgi:hypothetical protein